VRIGLLADTHVPSTTRVLWQEVRKVFQGVDLILHAGDLVTPDALDWCEELAPTLAARGNNDLGLEDPRIQDVQRLEVEGLRIAVVHDMEPEDRSVGYLIDAYLKGDGADVIVTGHTHFDRIAFRDNVLQVNPGSPTLPRLWSTRLGTVGILELNAGTLAARIVRLGETPGKPNPGKSQAFEMDRNSGRSPT
jgi:putative phosphoesterase